MPRPGSVSRGSLSRYGREVYLNNGRYQSSDGRSDLLVSLAVLSRGRQSAHPDSEEKSKSKRAEVSEGERQSFFRHDMLEICASAEEQKEQKIPRDEAREGIATYGSMARGGWQSRA